MEPAWAREAGRWKTLAGGQAPPALGPMEQELLFIKSAGSAWVGFKCAGDPKRFWGTAPLGASRYATTGETTARRGGAKVQVAGKRSKPLGPGRSLMWKGYIKVSMFFGQSPLIRLGWRPQKKQGKTKVSLSFIKAFAW